jgi:hypothetical protein
LTLVLPFIIIIQADIVVTIVYYGPFWLLDTSSVYAPQLYIYWFNLFVYLPFYGIAFGFVKLAYDAFKNDNTSRFDYLSKTLVVLFIHFILLVIFAVNSHGNPEPFEIPLPILGFISIFLTLFIKQPEVPWDSQETSGV